MYASRQFNWLKQFLFMVIVFLSSFLLCRRGLKIIKVLSKNASLQESIGNLKGKMENLKMDVLAGMDSKDKSKLTTTTIKPEEEIGEVMKHPECGCDIHVGIGTRFPLTDELDLPFDDQITCSRFASMRGSQQKVISYSYFVGENYTDDLDEVLLDGVERNFRGARRLYGEEWVLRIYHNFRGNSSKQLQFMCGLICEYPMIDMCYIGHNPLLHNAAKVDPRIWRHFVALDAQVDRFMVRDLDSKMIPREVVAEEEFEDSDSDVHVMRDHPKHHYKMLGGLWSAKLTKPTVRQAFKMAFKNFLEQLSSKDPAPRISEREFLDKHIWPWAQLICMQHDAYYCEEFPSNTKAFPRQRTGGDPNFVGYMEAEEITQIPLKKGNECPEACRREPDWTYC